MLGVECYTCNSSSYPEIIQCFYIFDLPDAGCTAHSSNSSDWLMKNLGPFSRFLQVKTMFELNPGFNPVRLYFLPWFTNAGFTRFLLAPVIWISCPFFHSAWRPPATDPDTERWVACAESPHTWRQRRHHQHDIWWPASICSQIHTLPVWAAYFAPDGKNRHSPHHLTHSAWS